ncbi:hypothetical protein VTH82DRAFT_590 [Thermothelomyces myriococcoides]
MTGSLSPPKVTIGQHAQEIYRFPSDIFELYRLAPPADRDRVIWPAVRVARSLSPSFSVTDASRLIASWLEGCETNHEECGLDVELPLPTRVIAVGAADEDPRLHETRPGETGRYAALSHCWGPPGSLSVKTTRTNLQQRKQAIPMQELPPTFSDAVHLSRALGIPYLWIDSLCIIQDDKPDWNREAEHMADVYGNATVTFSADAALSSKDGLFRPVREQRRVPAAVEYRCVSSPAGDEDESNYVYGRRIFVHDDPDTRASTVHSITNAPPWVYEPLHLRAWTLQEYLLSRRIAHFATGELLWDCRKAEGCECQIQQALTGRPQFRARDPNNWRIIGTDWWSIVETLSRRGMTYPDDSLPALAGIAKAVSTSWKKEDSYIAGHWKSELPLSLLWRRGGQFHRQGAVNYGGTNVPSRRQRRYVAPSWAWPSVVGPIHLDLYYADPPDIRERWVSRYDHKDRVCLVLDVSYELASSNPYGHLRSGSIVIMGVTLMLYGRVDVEDGEHQGKQGRLHVRFIRDEWQPNQPASPEDVLYLPIVANCYRTDYTKVSHPKKVHRVIQTKGLALKAVAGQDDTFVRVGFLRVYFYRRRQAAWKDRSECKSPRILEILKTEFQLPVRTVTII